MFCDADRDTIMKRVSYPYLIIALYLLEALDMESIYDGQMQSCDRHW